MSAQQMQLQMLRAQLQQTQAQQARAQHEQDNTMLLQQRQLLHDLEQQLKTLQTQIPFQPIHEQHAHEARALPSQVEARLSGPLMPGSNQGGGTYSIRYALASFDSRPYGGEYLSLEPGELVSIRTSSETQGWSYGARVRDGKHGWIPSDFLALNKPSQEEIVAAKAMQRDSHTTAESDALGSSIYNSKPSSLTDPAANDLALRQPGEQELPQPFGFAQQPEQVQNSGSGEDGRVYSREFLFSFAQRVKSGQDDEAQTECGQMKTIHAKLVAASSKTSSQHDGMLQSVILLLEAAGSKVRLGKLAEACTALAIMSGSHQQVYQDLLDLVEKWPECFEPVGLSSQKGSSKANQHFIRLTPDYSLALEGDEKMGARSVDEDDDL
eukprot:TRINITY_DN94113_c0_g1_i1.p1 TRINITY_DN94113_c0_g1~~TRINITY_DN94113_c0_g1_i1.p1  ORF type:complete len:382 (-),score=70.08 TRINITY_DN94113_c0_g1_i1:82-1227(-)